MMEMLSISIKTNKTVPKIQEGIHYTKLKFTVVEKNTLKRLFELLI